MNLMKRETITGIISVVFTVLGTILFGMSFSTGYYTYGAMNSGIITALLAVGIVMEVVTLFATIKSSKPWTKFLTYAVTALVAAAAFLLIGDRVEGIGNCLITDYDSGHGGEQAIFYSLCGSVSMIVGVIYNILGSFADEDADAARKERKQKVGPGSAAMIGIALAAVIGIVAVCSNLVGSVGGTSTGTATAAADGSTTAAGSDATASAEAVTYTISYNQNNNNVEGMPSYQFLCSDFSGLCTYDSRMYVDITLTLDGAGNYTLTSDSYVVENGARAVVGDDTGLGLVLTTTAEGTYTDNGDGTITTSAATHAVFEMETDTYSAQMKEAANMNVDGNTADGVYDSNDYPTVLSFVPETTFTVSDGAIVSYKKAGGDVYTVSFNQTNNNLDNLPDYQFLCSDFSGMVTYDSRMYLDVSLTLDGDGNYTLVSDSYVIENGARAEVGDDTGLGLVLTTTAEGTYTDNGDGTVTTDAATHAVFEMETDTYSAQMKEAANMNVDGNTDDGVYDSDEYPAVLDFVPASVFTLDGDAIVTWSKVGGDEDADAAATEDAQAAEDTDAADSGDADSAASGEAAEVFVQPSDDEGTTMTFYSDGTYKFYFASYDITDEGTYTYDGTTLTLTDANGKETTAEGDPLKLHYAYSQSDQLTGDYTIDAAEFGTAIANASADASGSGDDAGSDADAASASDADKTALLEQPSDDEGTTMTFYDDGTYKFYFASYDITDEGTYTYDGTTLTLTDANGKETTAEGDPLKLHYAYSQSDQLTGDYTINAADLAAAVK